ncbi:MAG: hypothetical protein NVS4B8_03110 [Herpetosiphon sp.]
MRDGIKLPVGDEDAAGIIDDSTNLQALADADWGCQRAMGAKGQAGDHEERDKAHQQVAAAVHNGGTGSRRAPDGCGRCHKRHHKTPVSDVQTTGADSK